jgi:hypothetical protein
MLGLVIFVLAVSSVAWLTYVSIEPSSNDGTKPTVSQQLPQTTVAGY